MRRVKDLAGNKYGRLTVLYRDTTVKKPRAWWHCKCDCGNEVTVISDSLQRGNTRSCGCLVKERHPVKHGDGVRNHRTSLYMRWAGMIGRCKNPNEPAYKNYGGRGISVCEEWLDYENYKEWAMKNGYKKGLTIDRIDVNGNYSPENCRWATRKEQQNNLRCTIRIPIGGKVYTLSDLEDMTGISRGKFYRIYRNGVDVEKKIANLLQTVV